MRNARKKAMGWLIALIVFMMFSLFPDFSKGLANKALLFFAKIQENALRDDLEGVREGMDDFMESVKTPEDQEVQGVEADQ